MAVSDLPPPSLQALRRGVRNERVSKAYARRLRNFAVARALVFCGAGGLVLWGLAHNGRGGLFGYSSKFVYSIVLIALVSASFQWWVSRGRNQIQNVVMGLLLVDQVLFASLVYLTGGVSSGATSLLGVGCVVGAALLGTAGAIASVVSGVILFSLILLIVEGAPDLLPPDQPASLYALGPSQAVFYYVFSILMLLLVGLLSGYLAERLARAGGEVVAARERAQRAEHMAVLGRLAAGLAHEIRSPLSAISGAVQMLRAGAEREEDEQLCDIVVRESARLDDLVSDMLQLSKTGERRLETVDLSQIARDVVHLAQRSGRSESDVTVDLNAEPGAWVRVDGSRIKQLTWNLVRNAVQASAAGGAVRVKVEREPTVRLSVEDDGVGIPPELRDRVFDDFFTTRTHGTGLGLAVVKRIADEHEISLEVVSERNKGALFSVDFGPMVPEPQVEME